MRYLPPIFLLVFLLSCSGGGDGSGPTEPTPVDHSPTASLSIQSSAKTGESVTSTCTGSDPDGDPITNYTFTPTPQTQTNGSATYVWTTEGSYSVSCTVTANGKTSSSSSGSVTVTKTVEATDIEALDDLVVGQTARFLLVGNQAGTWTVTGTDFTVVTISGDTLTVTITGTTPSLTATLTGQDMGGNPETAQYTESFTATSPITAAIQFTFKALDPREEPTGEVVIDGKTIQFTDGIARIEPEHGLVAGVYRISGSGNMTDFEISVELADGMVTQVDVYGEEGYDDLLAFMWGSGQFGACDVEGTENCTTRRWTTEDAPTFFVADDGHFSVEGNQVVFNRGDQSPDSLRLQDDHLAAISELKSEIHLLSGYTSSSLERTSSMTEEQVSFLNAGGVSWPRARIYYISMLGTSYVIDHNSFVEKSVIEKAINAVGAGYTVWPYQLKSDGAESLGFNTNPQISKNLLLERPSGVLKQPMATNLRDYFYVRPPASGRVNGVRDWVNNEDSPVPPSYPLTVGGLNRRW